MRDRCSKEVCEVAGAVAAAGLAVAVAVGGLGLVCLGKGWVLHDGLQQRSHEPWAGEVADAWLLQLHMCCAHMPRMCASKLVR